MLIVCPNCAATYRLAPAALGAGRPVRCARCKTEWYAQGSGETVAEAPAEAIQPIDDDVIDAHAEERSQERRDPQEAEALVPARASKRRPRVDRAGWRLSPGTALAALGLCALTLLIGGRNDITRAAPGMASLYARIGLPVNVRGLEIARVTSVEEMESGVPMLMVSGEIGNVAGRAVEVPRLRLAVLAGDGRELYAWTTVAGRTQLAKGETAAFRARLASPPAEGRRIAVRFLNSSDLPHGEDGA
ncbi:thioredoxin [Methylopila jiangsuensis]|uniref:Thioredoxin n=1 Tax=Methylopila jiangsuensis TaxID=586230 RepID=A0A9W6JJX4_9HYPH|nr:MJ0042-type zinc finger domain-containing protein [Methylopila jiangsuensis]MDR6284858.1 putative Zn finger-like uncharacterized protein [Methylopila jiangsuensis]GLK77751.1 thioredoxin [Methylopila jiangsuensis]